MKLKTYVPTFIVFSILLITFAGLTCTRQPDLSGSWRGSLQTKGGPAAFTFYISGDRNNYSGYLTNSSDTLEFTSVERRSDSLFLNIDYYDAVLRTEISADEQSLSGMWVRQDAGKSRNTLPFSAEKGITERYPLTDADHDRFEGEWAVTFTDEDGNSSPATGIFFTDANGRITGTFARETGDYRYLEGVFRDSSFILSSYTGARAYLFTADLQPNGTLKGEFWSRDNEYFTWTATLGEAGLRDPLNTAAAQDTGRTLSLSFPTTDGDLISTSAPDLQDKPLLVYLYGTWCPNCSDESALLKELINDRFAGSDLQIIGLAFEYTGDPDRDATMIRRYRERFDIPWTLAIAGTNDKENAAAQLSFTDQVLSFPTTYFADRDHVIQAVHVGFNGPATGPYYYREKERFIENIGKILDEGMNAD